MKYGNRPGTNKVENPQRFAGDLYTVSALRRAVQRACEQAFPPPEALQRKEVEGKRGKRKETDAEYRACCFTWDSSRRVNKRGRK